MARDFLESPGYLLRHSRLSDYRKVMGEVSAIPSATPQAAQNPAWPHSLFSQEAMLPMVAGHGGLAPKSTFLPRLVVGRGKLRPDELAPHRAASLSASTPLSSSAPNFPSCAYTASSRVRAFVFSALYHQLLSAKPRTLCAASQRPSSPCLIDPASRG